MGTPVYLICIAVVSFAVLAQPVAAEGSTPLLDVLPHLGHFYTFNFYIGTECFQYPTKFTFLSAI